MSLKDIFCQDRAIRLLQRALSADKVPHAYIFAAPEGVGKYTTAREWAKLLLCKNPAVEKNDGGDFADSCGRCQSCQSFNTGSHPDFTHIYKELREFTEEGRGKPAPLELPIDVIREFLVGKVSIKPALSLRKVFIVSEAEKLNVFSQNCLLKALEEPPLYCCIILLCTRLEQLLPTIKSRCQIIRFGPIEQGKVIEKLEQMNLDRNIAKFFSRLSQGSLGLACLWAKLQLADARLYETKKMLLTSISGCELADTLDLSQKFLDEGKRIAGVWAELDKTTSKSDIDRKAQKTLIQIIVSALHDAMKSDTTQSQELINFDQHELIKKLAARFSPEQSAQKVTDCYKLFRWLDDGVNEKLIFDHLLLNLSVSDIMKI
jgi:DNA polymerase-3 subunit delta'